MDKPTEGPWHWVDHKGYCTRVYGGRNPAGEPRNCRHG